MTEQWQELKETITEMRDNGGTGTQQEVCKFLANYMGILEKQMQQPCEDCISRKAVSDTIYIECSGENLDIDFAKVLLLQRAIKALPSVTPKAEQEPILDKIIAEIWEEAEWAYSDFDDYKEAVLEAEPDELPDDEFRFGLHRAVEIINKYKTESEG